MTRIISGFAGSLGLATPGTGTRPTSDRVREAIFSSLDARGALPGASVLDLYAGSGALGLEAASRGATAVTLVERHPTAIRVCRSNASLILKNAPRTSPVTIQVIGQSVQTFLLSDQRSWDIVLMDPPYEVTEAELLQSLTALAPRLGSGSVLILESSSRSPEPEWPAGLELERRKVYGDTTLWWIHQPVVDSSGESPVLTS